MSVLDIKFKVLTELQEKHKFNLIDTEEPEVKLMQLGKGYSFCLDIRKATDRWYIMQCDAGQEIKHSVYSDDVDYTIRKDPETLARLYDNMLLDIAFGREEART